MKRLQLSTPNRQRATIRRLSKICSSVLIVLGVMSASAFAQVASVTTPAIPTNLSVRSPLIGCLLLTWTDNSTNEQKFNIGLDDEINVATSAPANTTATTICNLNPTTNYHVHVQACALLANCSGWTQPAVTGTPSGPPTSPVSQNLCATPLPGTVLPAVQNVYMDDFLGNRRSTYGMFESIHGNAPPTDTNHFVRVLWFAPDGNAVPEATTLLKGNNQAVEVGLTPGGSSKPLAGNWGFVACYESGGLSTGVGYATFTVN